MLANKKPYRDRQWSAEELQAIDWLGRFAETGDRKALADFFRCYEKRVFGFCRSVLKGASEAEDAAQATFIDVMRRAKEYSTIKSVRFWLFGLARKACATISRSNLRRSRREYRSVHERPDANFNTPQSKFEQAETRAVLLKAIHHLPESSRAIFFMRFAQKMSHREIAKTLGMKERTVRSSVMHMLQQLKLKLSHCGITAMPASLVCVFIALGEEAPRELTRSLLKLSQAPMNPVSPDADPVNCDSAMRPSGKRIDLKRPLWLWTLASLASMALAGSFAAWFGPAQAQLEKGASKESAMAPAPQRSNLQNIHRAPIEQFWDFNDRSLAGLKMAVGNFKFVPPKSDPGEVVLEFLPMPQDEKRYPLGSPIVFTPTALNLHPPVLVEFKCGTGVLKRFQRFTVFANGAYWSDKEGYPPALQDLLDPNDLFKSKRSLGSQKLRDLPHEGIWVRHSLYIFKQEIICVESENRIHRYKMQRPWQGVRDRLYLLWILQRGDALLENLHIKQLKPEELPTHIRAAQRF